MKILLNLLSATTVAILVSGCSTSSTSPSATATPSPHTPGHEVVERWAFEFDGRPWKLGHQAATRQGAIREYVVPGQSVQKWSELVTSVYFVSSMPARPFFDEVRRTLSSGCPTLQVAILEESSDAILFEWRHEGCQGYPAQHEIRRISTLPTGTYTLSFVEKTRQLAPEKRAAWISILKGAKVRPEG